MLIERYQSCVGLSLPAFGKWKIELWLALPGYKIKPHSHDNVNIKLTFLFGHNVMFHRIKKNAELCMSFMAQLRHIGKTFTINAGDIHWFEVSRFPLIFINVEKWFIKPSSASIDLQLANSIKKDIYARKTN